MKHGEKNPYYNNLRSFRLDLITGLESIEHQKFPEKRFASKSYSEPGKLKFRKHTVSEKDRDFKMLATFQPHASPEDVLIVVPQRNLTERDGCALTVMSDYA
ncbi:hypothetical protein TNIN_119141 [Trichonephila inaurata madagascariensis]|uniref:Uncharacterized protein n=1 Tax=Trichonephila inaurata madagascariensis TaxID=2747483 RepID=A0A8X6WSN2_9ARAC|nr:hypothetical protein TNIN_276781 [Trichonephila inaurata madagascariensis]GFY40726.1 hypothetical protein TNIN_119141 [Trichonephila inaurata madagascariensis]